MQITIQLNPEQSANIEVVKNYLQTIVDKADVNSLRILHDLSKKKEINDKLKKNEFKIKLAL